MNTERVDNGFGMLRVEPVSVQKKDGLILPETGGMRAVRIARAMQGPLKGQYIMYRTHVEVRAEHKGEMWVLIPEDACLSVVELDENETAVPLVEVSPDIGQDNGWIG